MPVMDIDGDEQDKKDETWCLYDGQLLDDELNVSWANFAPGTRVLIFSDSCHSGSVSKGPGEVLPESSASTRDMPRKRAIAVARKNYEFYDNIQLALPQPRTDVTATVVLYSGCQDSQLSLEGPDNGHFTMAVRDTWQGGSFTGDHHSFYQEILKIMPKNQTPNLLLTGNTDKSFLEKPPFEL